MIVLCQSTFISYNKGIGGDIVREAMHVWGQGVYGESLYPPLNFAVNLEQLNKRQGWGVEKKKKKGEENLRKMFLASYYLGFTLLINGYCY